MWVCLLRSKTGQKNKMETFEFVSAVRGYHNYKDIWEPSVGEKLIAHREFGNQFDKFAIKVLKRLTNSGPSTTRKLENSVVFSRSWRINYP